MQTHTTPGKTYVDCLRMVGWSLVGIALVYLTLVTSRPDWCPTDAQHCAEMRAVR